MFASVRDRNYQRLGTGKARHQQRVEVVKTSILMNSHIPEIIIMCEMYVEKEKDESVDASVGWSQFHLFLIIFMTRLTTDLCEPSIFYCPTFLSLNIHPAM